MSIIAYLAMLFAMVVYYAQISRFVMPVCALGGLAVFMALETICGESLFGYVAIAQLLPLSMDSVFFARKPFSRVSIKLLRLICYGIILAATIGLMRYWGDYGRFRIIGSAQDHEYIWIFYCIPFACHALFDRSWAIWRRITFGYPVFIAGIVAIAGGDPFGFVFVYICVLIGTAISVMYFAWWTSTACAPVVE